MHNKNKTLGSWNGLVGTHSILTLSVNPQLKRNYVKTLNPKPSQEPEIPKEQRTLKLHRNHMGNSLKLGPLFRAP